MYESINDQEPKIGDWVICELHKMTDIPAYYKYNEIISNNIGQLVEINEKKELNCIIKYFNNIGKDNNWFYDDHTCVNMNEILYWSKDKKELEDILAAKKYNL